MTLEENKHTFFRVECDAKFYSPKCSIAGPKCDTYESAKKIALEGGWLIHGDKTICPCHIQHALNCVNVFSGALLKEVNNER